jgi:hypothetical protein
MSPITRSKSASANAVFNTDMNTYELQPENEVMVDGAGESGRGEGAEGVDTAVKKVISDAIEQAVQEAADAPLPQSEICYLERVVNCDFPSLEDELEAAQVLADMKSTGEEFSGRLGGGSEKLTPDFMKKLIDVSVPFADLLTPENKVKVNGKKKKKTISGSQASVGDVGSEAVFGFSDGIRQRLKKHRSEGDLDVVQVESEVADEVRGEGEVSGGESGDGEVFLEEKKLEDMVYGNDIDVRAEVEMKEADAYCVEKKMMNREFTVCEEDGVVLTLEGEVDVKKGDYIMKGSEGERWPLTPLKFRQTYTEKSVPEIYEYSTMAGGVFFAYLLLAIYFNFSNFSVNLVSILYFAMFFPQKKIAIPKSKVVYAKQMREPFYVKVSWNDSALVGKADDYLLEYGIGDYGVVDKEIFQKTYTILD